MGSILVFVAIAITAGVYAQTDSTNRKTSPRNLNNTHNHNMQNNPADKSHPDGVMMRNGKVMKVKNGQMTILQENDMTLSNGTKIMSDGTCIKKDGTKMTLKEGQHMDMSGTMIPMKTNKDKNMDYDHNKQNNSQDLNKNKNQSAQNNSQDLNNTQNQNMQNNSGDKTHPDGVMMQNGKVMKVKNGQMTILQENDMTLSNGTKIMSDGTCIKKDGTKMTLKEGQHMDMSGNLVPMKTNKDKNMYLVPDSTKKKKY